MKILLCHNYYQQPGGEDQVFADEAGLLQSHGHEVVNPALPDDDFDAAVKIAQADFDRHQPDVVVGSSWGGASFAIA